MKIAPWNKAGFFLRCWLAPKSTSAMALAWDGRAQIGEVGVQHPTWAQKKVNLTRFMNPEMTLAVFNGKITPAKAHFFFTTLFRNNTNEPGPHVQIPIGLYLP